jgi:recombinational DNA repair protein (RecF pathway)
MALAGYEPRLDACIRCDRSFDERSGIMVASYSPPRGGALCDECASQAREETMPLSQEAARMMQQLAAEDDARNLAATDLMPETASQMNRALRAHLRYRLERDVRSTAFLDAFRVGAMDELGETAPPV